MLPIDPVKFKQPPIHTGVHGWKNSASKPDAQKELGMPQYWTTIPQKNTLSTKTLFSCRKVHEKQVLQSPATVRIASIGLPRKRVT
jgi:hypothetical protein